MIAVPENVIMEGKNNRGFVPSSCKYFIYKHNHFGLNDQIHEQENTMDVTNSQSGKRDWIKNKN